MVNHGYFKIKSIKISPSVGWSVFHAYVIFGIDKETDKKGLIDPPCSRY